MPQADEITRGCNVLEIKHFRLLIRRSQGSTVIIFICEEAIGGCGIGERSLLLQNIMATGMIVSAMAIFHN